MQILKVLIKESAMDMYRDLTGNQSTVLYRVVTGKTTPDTASPRELKIMDELVDLGLLDTYFEPTKLGRGVVHVSDHKHGSQEGREIQKRMQALGQKPYEGNRRYSEVGDHGDNIDGEEVPNLASGARAIDSGAIVR